jgi:hypothetical protein
MQECLRKSVGLLDVELLTELWRRFRELPRAGADVMTHGDLIPGNVLVDHEHLAVSSTVAGSGRPTYAESAPAPSRMGRRTLDRLTAGMVDGGMWFS